MPTRTFGRISRVPSIARPPNKQAAIAVTREVTLPPHVICGLLIGGVVLDPEEPPRIPERDDKVHGEKVALSLAEVNMGNLERPGISLSRHTLFFPHPHFPHTLATLRN